MNARRLLLLLPLLALPLLAGCGGEGEESPFDGNWVSAEAGELKFEGSTWVDSDGDSGEYSFAGEYPVFTVTFFTGSGSVDRLATFADERAFELCAIAPDGALFDCTDFVLDKPTIH